MSNNEETEKKLIENMKTYLASISARGLQYAYFNIAQDTVILSNSSSNRPGARHGDRLTAYRSGELALQVIKFKSKELFTDICTTLKIPKDGIYMVNTSRLNALLGKSSLSELDIHLNEGHELIMIPKGETYDDKKHLIGMSIIDFHIRAVLIKLYQESQVVGTSEHRSKYPHCLEAMESEYTLYGNAYVTYVNTHNFKAADGSLLFEQCYPKIQLISYDGLSAPSFKSFLKKLRKPYKLISYFWVENEHYIRTFNYYEDDTVRVKCLRPYLILSPVSTKYRFDFNLNIFE
jgi:hypothetical protein